MKRAILIFSLILIIISVSALATSILPGPPGPNNERRGLMIPPIVTGDDQGYISVPGTNAEGIGGEDDPDPELPGGGGFGGGGGNPPLTPIAFPLRPQNNQISGAITIKTPTTDVVQGTNIQALIFASSLDSSSIQSSTITGAIVSPAEPTQKNAYTIAIILIIALTLLGILAHLNISIHTKVAIVSALFFIVTFATLNVSGPPTGLISYQPSNTFTPLYVNNPFTIYWTGGGPVSFLPANNTQCSDSIDNDGDGLNDANDPGCHTDGNASNSATYVSIDDLEQDMIEYNLYTSDNRAHISEVVQLVRYINGTRSFLIHCTDSTCSTGTFNCTGSPDVNDDSSVNSSDVTYLQTVELNGGSLISSDAAPSGAICIT